MGIVHQNFDPPPSAKAQQLPSAANAAFTAFAVTLFGGSVLLAVAAPVLDWPLLLQVTGTGLLLSHWVAFRLGRLIAK